MTYYPSDCPNAPRVFEPDALSFLGGGGSEVALREAARGLHRTAQLLELERRDAPLLRLHSLFPRGKERMALEAGRTRTADRLAQGSRVQRLGSSGSHILRANESILCGASVRKKARKRLRRPSTSQDNRRPFRGT